MSPPPKDQQFAGRGRGSGSVLGACVARPASTRTMCRKLGSQLQSDQASNRNYYFCTSTTPSTSMSKRIPVLLLLLLKRSIEHHELALLREEFVPPFLVL